MAHPDSFIDHVLGSSLTIGVWVFGAVVVAAVCVLVALYIEHRHYGDR